MYCIAALPGMVTNKCVEIIFTQLHNAVNRKSNSASNFFFHYLSEAAKT